MKTNNEEIEQIDAELLHDLQQIKKTMKALSKNQLIGLVLQQMKISMEMQNINKVLAERLKEMEGNKDEVKE